jgi:hypothetical protein
MLMLKVKHVTGVRKPATHLNRLLRQLEILMPRYGEMMHGEVLGNLPQAIAGGREEMADQPASDDRKTAMWVLGLDGTRAVHPRSHQGE